jgi:hypothetical protein
MLNETVPLFNERCASVVVPSWNVTMPVGAGDPPVTAAVNVAVSPGADGLGDDVRAVVVAKA